MKLIFIWGGAASGKLTVARELSKLTGIAVFHNHLVVDALLEKYEFGDPEFVRLREAMWMTVFDTAARAGQSLIFTFAPEASVEPDFPQRVLRVIEEAGGELKFVRLLVSQDEQERRIADESRKAFRKLVSLDLLKKLRVVVLLLLMLLQESRSSSLLKLLNASLKLLETFSDSLRMKEITSTLEIFLICV